jgi:hypothetical protein
MNITRVAALAAILLGTSVGVAGPAHAEPISGTYSAVIGTGSTTTQTWVFTPCGPDCTSLDRGAGLTIQELRRQGTAWSYTYDDGSGVPCTTTIDSVSLAGETGCSFMKFPVQLIPAG